MGGNDGDYDKCAEWEKERRRLATTPGDLQSKFLFIRISNTWDISPRLISRTNNVVLLTLPSSQKVGEFINPKNLFIYFGLEKYHDPDIIHFGAFDGRLISCSKLATEAELTTLTIVKPEEAVTNNGSTKENRSLGSPCIHNAENQKFLL